MVRGPVARVSEVFVGALLDYQKGNTTVSRPQNQMETYSHGMIWYDHPSVQRKTRH